MERGPAKKWTAYQQRAIDCIACQRGIPTRSVRYFSADHVVVLTRPRFNTRRLAAKLTRVLRDLREEIP